MTTVMSSRVALMGLLPAVACADDPPRAEDVEPDFEHCFDDRPRPLAVVIDPTLVVEGFSYECTGDADWGDGACLAPPEKVYATIDGDLNFRLREMGIQGWWPLIEATETAARTCGVRYTDYEWPSANCEDPVCATAGSLTLSRFPTLEARSLAARLDVSFANGATMRVTFNAVVEDAGD